MTEGRGTPTLYEVLGVPSGATRDEIRVAYVAQARASHPDRHAGEDTAARAAATDRMQAVNDAWRVLRDPEARAAYDRSLVAPQTARAAQVAAAAAAGLDEVDVPFHPTADLAASVVRSLPWIVVLAVLAAIFVFTAFARQPDPATTPVAELIGRCVAVGIGGELDVVACSEPNDGRVQTSVADLAHCPSGTRPIARGEGFLCVRPQTE